MFEHSVQVEHWKNAERWPSRRGLQVWSSEARLGEARLQQLAAELAKHSARWRISDFSRDEHGSWQLQLSIEGHARVRREQAGWKWLIEASKRVWTAIESRGEAPHPTHPARRTVRPVAGD